MEIFTKDTIVNKVLNTNILSSMLDYDLRNTSVKTVCIKSIVNLDNSPIKNECEYKELYVVEVVLKDLEIPKEFLQKLDNNIFFPTLYVLKYKTICNYIISIKEQKNNHLKILRVFDRGWGKEIEKFSLHPISIISIFKQLLKSITTVKFEKQQTFKEYIASLIKDKRNCFKIDKFIINKGHTSFLQIKDSIKVLGCADWDNNTIDTVKNILISCFVEERRDSDLEKLKEYMYKRCISELKNKALIRYMRPTLSNNKLISIFENLIQTKYGTMDKLGNGWYSGYFTQVTINVNSIYNHLYAIE